MRRRLRSLYLLVLVLVVAAGVPAAVASPLPQSIDYGGVVQLEGTPHLWISASGELHWAGDTRALAGRYVNWSDRRTLTLEALQRYPIGDPWLSAGLLKIGDPIYLVKWETHEPAPTLLHIQSIADVELFGINGGNYGRFVLDQTGWEQRYGFAASSLSRGVLGAAVAAPPHESRFRLSTPTIAVGEGVVWVTGEVTNAGGGAVTGFVVAANVFKTGGVTIRGRYEAPFALAPGQTTGYKIVVSDSGAGGAVSSAQVGAVTGSGSLAATATADLSAEFAYLLGQLPGRLLGEFVAAQARGTISNTTGRAIDDVRVLVWYLTGSGDVIDVVEKMYSEFPAFRLEPGEWVYVASNQQSNIRGASSISSQENASVRSITRAKGLAYGRG